MSPFDPLNPKPIIPGPRGHAEELLHKSGEIIEDLHQDARFNGIADPIIFLFDIEEPTAHPFASALLGRSMEIRGAHGNKPPIRVASEYKPLAEAREWLIAKGFTHEADELEPPASNKQVQVVMFRGPTPFVFKTDVEFSLRWQGGMRSQPRPRGV